ncbi:MAG: hypothetical protein Q7U34_15510 [Anaerolineales bacterium]|nr:hypothetical protein [Anaerolineales bacterium]
MTKNLSVTSHFGLKISFFLGQSLEKTTVLIGCRPLSKVHLPFCSGLINQIAPEHVQLIGIPTHDLISQIKSGALGGQQVLLYVSFNKPSWHPRANENPARLSLIEAIKKGQIPPPGSTVSTASIEIGATLAMPDAVIP